MSSEKKFYTEIQSTDISIQSEDGGGLKFDNNSKYFFSSKQQSTINSLIEQNHNSNIDINGTDQSFMALINDGNQVVDLNVGNNNINSLFSPSENTFSANPYNLFTGMENEIKDILFPPTQGTQEITPQENFLPDNELSYMNSKYFNSVGEGAEGTGFEEDMSPEEAQQIIDRVNNRSYNKI
jgi:hypothetical protein